MNENTHLDFIASLPLGWFVLLILLALGFSWWTYLRTWPPSRPFLRITLTILRWGSLTIAILILIKPSIMINRSFGEKPSVLLLVDKSISMGIKQGETDRLKDVDEFLTSDAFKRFDSQYRIEAFSFGDTVISYEDLKIVRESPTVENATDISSSWLKARDRIDVSQTAAAILISDGAHNKGADPARMAKTVGFPVYCLGVGSVEQDRDLMITSVLTNPVVYQGSETSVEIGYRAVGANGQTASLIIRDSGGIVVATRRVRVAGEYFEGSVSLDIKLDEAGKKRFSAEIQPLDNELTTDNNHRSFYMNILASKMTILIMAGAPDNSLGDMIRRLKKDEHLKLITRTMKNRGFYEGDWPATTDMNSVDVVILHDFPGRNTDPVRFREFASVILEKDLPLCFIDGGEVDYRLLKELDERLPVSWNERNTQTGSGQVIPSRMHAIIAEPEENDFRTGWERLPPVTMALNRFSVKPDAVRLADANPENSPASIPAITVLERGGSKSAAILIRDMWRWGLQSPGESGIVEPFWERTIRWLALRTVEKTVQLSFNKDFFTNLENINFTVLVRDENMVPVDGADIRVKVSKDGEIGGNAGIESVGNGRYRGVFRAWDDGEYRVDVEAFKSEQQLGTDRAKIVVEPFSNELLDTRLNETLLRSISDNSGGSYAKIDNAESILDSLEFSPIEVSEERKIEIWGRGWLLIAIIILLTAEWFLRIRSGML